MTALTIAPQETTGQPTGSAYLTGTGTLHIDGLQISDAAVTAEACRWTSGARGEPADLESAVGLPVDAFVRAAVSIGASMLGHASEASVMALASHVSQLAERAESASTALVRAAGQAAAQNTAAATQAARAVHESTAKTLESALRRFEQDAEKTLSARVTAVDTRLTSLLAGESSEVAAAVRRIVTGALAESQAGWHASATATLAEVHRAFDPSNEANPLALATRQIELTQQRHHSELGGRIDRLAELVAAAAGAASSAAALAAVEQRSPAKGGSFEQQLGSVLEAVAAGLGASYDYTGDRAGAIRNCRKGDAVIELPQPLPGGPTPRILIEATTQTARRDWVNYMPEAEKNRGCQVSIGIVPTPAGVPGGEALALLGTTRAVVAFDPSVDSPALLRGVVQLLAVEASRRIATSSGSDTALADTKVAAARQQLSDIVAIQKLASASRDNAGKVVTGLDALHSALAQSLDQALAALRSGAVA